MSLVMKGYFSISDPTEWLLQISSLGLLYSDKIEHSFLRFLPLRVRNDYTNKPSKLNAVVFPTMHFYYRPELFFCFYWLDDNFLSGNGYHGKIMSE